MANQTSFLFTIVIPRTTSDVQHGFFAMLAKEYALIVQFAAQQRNKQRLLYLYPDALVGTGQQRFGLIPAFVGAGSSQNISIEESPAIRRNFE